MPDQTTVYRRYMGKDDDGKEVELVEELQLFSVDARDAVRKHPKEYSYRHPHQKAKPKAAEQPAETVGAKVEEVLAQNQAILEAAENSGKQFQELLDAKDADIEDLKGTVSTLSDKLDQLTADNAEGAKAAGAAADEGTKDADNDKALPPETDPPSETGEPATKRSTAKKK